jgi:hypothetical protein
LLGLNDDVVVETGIVPERVDGVPDQPAEKSALSFAALLRGSRS